MKIRWSSLSMPVAFGSGCSAEGLAEELANGLEDDEVPVASGEEPPPPPPLCVHAAASVRPATRTVAATVERRRARTSVPPSHPEWAMRIARSETACPPDPVPTTATRDPAKDTVSGSGEGAVSG